MTNKLLTTFVLCFFIITGVTYRSIAGGFQLGAQSNRQLAMAHTGTGMFRDASSVFFNPGAFGMDSLRFRINAGTTFLFPAIQYAALSPSVYSIRANQFIGTPVHAYITVKPSQKIPVSLGMGVYTPFGSSLTFEDNWKGRFIVQEISLKTIFYQPTISVKINSWLGIGAGYCFATGEFLSRRSLPLMDLNGEFGSATLSGPMKGNGWNFGVYLKPSSNLEMGLNYKNAIKANINGGIAEFNVPDYTRVFFPDTTSFSTSIILPSQLNIGITYKVNKKLSLAFDFNRVDWSTYDTLKIDFLANTAQLTDAVSIKNWKASNTYRLGAEYRLNDKLTLMGGAFFDDTPIPTNYLSPDAPDAKKYGLTCGASFMPVKNLSVDLSLLYIETFKREDSSVIDQFAGIYKVKAPGVGLSISYTF